MTTSEWYLFGHLLGVFLLLAAAGLSTATGVMAGRVRSAATVVTLLDMQRFSELVVTSAGVILVVVFGSLLVDEQGFSFGDPWISAAFTLLIVVLAIDHGLLMRRNREARAVAAALGPNASVTEELSARINDPLTIVFGALLDVSFLVFLWLMIAKPGA
jgi:uncharacterized membrane protein